MQGWFDIEWPIFRPMAFTFLLGRHRAVVWAWFGGLCRAGVKGLS